MPEKREVSEVEAYMNLHRRIHGQGEPAFEDPEMQYKTWGNAWGLERKGTSKLRQCTSTT